MDIKDTDEEGTGTGLIINHKHPEIPGDQITVTATVQKINRNELVCSVGATVGTSVIAEGETR
ncbi:hypothetical protein AAE02nite_44170 [Adhaeribacter aerolatus]|uniref:Fluoroacetyl-CoA-specific thioesterase-like domain-containing protein n=1 Tax=Adhaeribacter aerolatus TaxID=670289 RepID=A0A512B459_9BACT|nr:hypothetical protein [Adhaeribacter aerolatus]GEO06753.1 hypothetical protein AAE02nite_44170 [Adhaeribacter aerolatus]